MWCLVMSTLLKIIFIDPSRCFNPQIKINHIFDLNPQVQNHTICQIWSQSPSLPVTCQFEGVEGAPFYIYLQYIYVQGTSVCVSACLFHT